MTQDEYIDELRREIDGLRGVVLGLIGCHDYLGDKSGCVNCGRGCSKYRAAHFALENCTCHIVGTDWVTSHLCPYHGVGTPR